jgi:MFS family permease
VWFVVGLPFFLYSELHWSFWKTGTLLAAWVIGYGAVQAAAPRFVRKRGNGPDGEPDGRMAAWLAFGVALCPAAIALALDANLDPTATIVIGLIPFAIAFAANSAVHSYLILAYADDDKVTMNVGFYYMANAFGRLAGTILSGLIYQWHGLTACLWVSTVFLIVAGLLSLLLPTELSATARRTELSQTA